MAAWGTRSRCSSSRSRSGYGSSWRAPSAEGSSNDPPRRPAPVHLGAVAVVVGVAVVVVVGGVVGGGVVVAVGVGGVVAGVVAVVVGVTVTVAIFLERAMSGEWDDEPTIPEAFDIDAANGEQFTPEEMREITKRLSRNAVRVLRAIDRLTRCMAEGASEADATCSTDDIAKIAGVTVPEAQAACMELRRFKLIASRDLGDFRSSELS